MTKSKKRAEKHLFLIVAIASLLAACGPKKIVTGETDARLSAKQLIKNHYKNQLRFLTVRGRIKVDYKSGDNSKSFTMSFRMEKDKTIWMSAPLNMAKVLITPGRVSFYSKLDDTYFDGDFSYISQLLGTELDFYKLQNLLLGESVFDLTEERYNAVVAENAYQLTPEKEKALFKSLLLLEPVNFKIALQQLSQPQEGRVLTIQYKTYQLIEEKPFPEDIVITAEDGKNKITIELEYRSMEFNQKLTFPYDIPEGYKEITADK